MGGAAPGPAQGHGGGITALATRVSGVSDLVEEGRNGCLVDPGNPEALAGAIVELFRAPEARVRLGAAARRTVREHYSLEAMLARLERLYLELLERKGHPGR